MLFNLWYCDSGQVNYFITLLTRFVFSILFRMCACVIRSKVDRFTAYSCVGNKASSARARGMHCTVGLIVYLGPQ